MYCPKCGKYNHDGSAFCGQCGTSLLFDDKQNKNDQVINQQSEVINLDPQIIAYSPKINTNLNDTQPDKIDNGDLYNSINSNNNECEVRQNILQDTCDYQHETMDDHQKSSIDNAQESHNDNATINKKIIYAVLPLFVVLVGIGFGIWKYYNISTSSNKIIEDDEYLNESFNNADNTTIETQRIINKTEKIPTIPSDAELVSLLTKANLFSKDAMTKEAWELYQQGEAAPCIEYSGMGFISATGYIHTMVYRGQDPPDDYTFKIDHTEIVDNGESLLIKFLCRLFAGDEFMPGIASLKYENDTWKVDDMGFSIIGEELSSENYWSVMVKVCIKETNRKIKDGSLLSELTEDKQYMEESTYQESIKMLEDYKAKYLK